jgi:hypothetical protein
MAAINSSAKNAAAGNMLSAGAAQDQQAQPAQQPHDQLHDRIKRRNQRPLQPEKMAKTLSVVIALPEPRTRSPAAPS